MQPLSLSEVTQSFDAVDQSRVVLPRFTWVDWSALDFLAWSHPSEALAYLVAVLPERPVGLVLTASSQRGRGMCDLCLGLDRSQGTRLFTVENWHRPRLKQGIFICSELNCSDTVRGGSWVYRMSETISAGRRIERLQGRLEGFVRAVSGLTGNSLRTQP